MPNVGRFDDIVEGDRPAHWLQRELPDPLPQCQRSRGLNRPKQLDRSDRADGADQLSDHRRQQPQSHEHKVALTRSTTQTRHEVAPLPRRADRADGRPSARRQRASDAVIRRQSRPIQQRQQIWPSGTSARKMLQPVDSERITIPGAPTACARRGWRHALSASAWPWPRTAAPT